MKNYHITIILALGCCIALFQSCRDEWDDHYENNASRSDKSLYEMIQEDSDLSDFSRLLEVTGYDSIIAGEQTYTVWAPVNSAFLDVDFEDKEECLRIVKNHIGRFNNSASYVDYNRIYMLSGKYIVFEEISPGNYQFGEQTLISNDKIARNGLLHKINDQVAYGYNIWEYMESGENLDSIGKYLYSFNEKIFVESASTLIGVNEEGKPVYDSVFYYSNSMYRQLGYLNEEDSIYTMIMPNNTAWIEAMNRLTPYFRSVNRLKGDSIREAHAKAALVQDLVFRKEIRNPEQLTSPRDSLVSTKKNIFYAPSYLFEGAQSKSLSNGLVYTTSKLHYNAWESWQQTIVWEAENGIGRTNLVSTLSTMSSLDSEIDSISGNRYLVVVPTSAVLKPSVTFSIPNTLAAAYNIYCVFLPENLFDLTRNGRPGKVSFDLGYIKEGETIPTTTKMVPPYGNETIPGKRTKMLVAENFKFPYANYNENTTTVTLKVTSEVLSSETVNYDRDMRIDCIILEPVH